MTHHGGLSPARSASEQSPPGPLQALPTSTQSGAALKAVLSTVDPQVQALQAVVLCGDIWCSSHRVQVEQAVEHATGLGRACGITVSGMPTAQR